VHWASESHLQLNERGVTMREMGEEMGASAAGVCHILKAHRRPAPHN
jgi:hypothetical protein